MIEFVSRNGYLTSDEMKINARHVGTLLYSRGWTVNSIAAMLGNMESESTINPGIWENLDEGNLNGGYGLVQWTPASKYLDWCTVEGLEPSSLLSALLRIEYEIENGLQWISTALYPMTFQEFKTSTDDVERLAMAFLYNYERPKSLNQPQRATQARAWLEFLTSENLTPTPKPKKKKTMPLWMMVEITRR